MRCRLIAFDLDGTLLDNRKRIPEENLRALGEAASRGIPVVPATGRILRGLPAQLRELPFLRYCILSNGAAVCDIREDRLLFRGDIPLELALRVLDFLDTQPVLYDCYQNDRGWMSQRMYEQAPVFFREEPEILKLVELLRVRVPDLRQTLIEHGEPLQKIQFYYRPEDNAARLAMLDRFSSLFPELLASSSTSNNVELNSAAAGKGNGLLALCASLGIDPADCLAFGDGLNDIPMLEAAGRGVAMANAGEAVKAAADAVCESNEDCGVACEIRRVFAAEDAERAP